MSSKYRKAHLDLQTAPPKHVGYANLQMSRMTAMKMMQERTFAVYE